MKNKCDFKSKNLFVVSFFLCLLYVPAMCSAEAPYVDITFTENTALYYSNVTINGAVYSNVIIGEVTITGSTGNGTSNPGYLTSTGTITFSENETFVVSGNVAGNSYRVEGTYEIKSMSSNGNYTTQVIVTVQTTNTDGLDTYYGVPAGSTGTFVLQISNDSQKVRSGTLDLNAYAVPLPAGAWLLGSGIVGIFGLRRKMRN
jgi:hypothetical protein